MNPGLDWRDSIYDSPTRGDVREGYPKSNCLELWERHKRFTHTLWGLFPGWIPYGFLVIEALIVGLHLPMNSVFVAIVPYALALVIVENAVSSFRCPRCGSRFYAWGPFELGLNGFARKCRNCGLPQWQCIGPSDGDEAYLRG